MHGSWQISRRLRGGILATAALTAPLLFAASAASQQNSRSACTCRFFGQDYHLGETICLRGDRAYVGDSRSGTIIQQAGGAYLAAVLASDTWCENRAWTGAPLRISSLTVDANRAFNTGSSGIVLRCREPLVQDVHVQNMPSDGIVVTDVARDGSTR